MSMWHNDGSNVSTLEKKTKDLPYPGRPKLWDIENIRRVLEENLQTSTHGLSEELGASIDTMHRLIKALGKSYRSCRCVYYELTPQQAQRRVDICRQLISNPMDDRFITRIVICDDK